jgi:hypothetical protein
MPLPATGGSSCDDDGMASDGEAKAPPPSALSALPDGLAGAGAADRTLGAKMLVRADDAGA